MCIDIHIYITENPILHPKIQKNVLAKESEGEGECKGEGEGESEVCVSTVVECFVQCIIWV